MKKLVSLALVLGLVVLLAAPAAAKGIDDEITPVRGGLVYDTIYSAYVLQGQCIGAIEYKTVTAKLYKKNGTSWTYVDSTSNSGTTMLVSRRFLCFSDIRPPHCANSNWISPNHDVFPDRANPSFDQKCITEHP